ncbi:Smr/MutS family protein [Terrihabitans rhizophilus]|jgi:DNA-nicking Smr family endonuclease|uniref:Smr/MutS family protein n=1 Tax=Terrihabitans rhizophilus TaxID=3092662 RepID=A0ABU4RRP9_9HYPH|nr:Smr/MutS family protein [Terrihabitans sp. PJ23]MDX6807524.1 Smr/MutS family protein [Terrihabitans sp. PJ23]
MKRRRDLTGEERELWDVVVKSVTPLRHRKFKRPEQTPVLAAEPTPPSEKPKGKVGIQPAPKPLPSKPPVRPLAPIEPKIARNLRRGGEVDARIDLHGLRQDEAHARLRSFIHGAQARGARVVLVITGKGAPAGDRPLFDERGVLRRHVPSWLSEPGMRDVVLGFSEASPAHGGAGALYVRIRRTRGTA